MPENVFGHSDDEDIPDLTGFGEDDENEVEEPPAGETPAATPAEPAPAPATTPAEPAPADPPAETGSDQQLSDEDALKAVQAGEPAPPAAEAQPAEEETPQAENEQPKKWAGRWDTPEEMEQGYAHIRKKQNETAVRNAQLEAELARLRAASGQPPAPAPGQIDLGEEHGLTPEQVQQIVDQRQAEHDAVQARNSAVASFQAAHQTELTPELESDVTALAIEFQRPPFNYDLDADLLEIALETARNPHLETVLRANPHLIETDEGMVVARNNAAQLAGVAPVTPAVAAPVTPAPTPSAGAPAPASQQPAATPAARPPAGDTRANAVAAAQVVTGSGDGPPPDQEGTPGEDPWEEVLALHKKNAASNRSPLGV